MNNPKQMREIRQQNQQVQSISLNSNSILQQNNVIQQYDNLQFSDERGHDSSQQGELSVQKLKFLGIDKFPGQYAHKIKEISQTRVGVSQFLNGNNQGARISTGTNFHRKSNKSNKKMNQNQAFHIDSFLNSRPSMNNKNYLQHQRRKNNSNAFQKVLQQHGRGRQKKYSIFSESQKESNKQVRENYQQRNKQIKDFIKRNQKSHICLKPQQKRSNSNYNSHSHRIDDSITLITLPQPQIIPQQKYSIPKHRNKHNKAYSYSNYFDNDQQLHNTTDTKLFQVRFEQAKINFMDSFLPQNMKIGNNPYNFLKYANSKNNGFFKMI